ncbi:MAG: hypothetical protein H6712_32575 [Myxococcales bacterium]|nr:Fpg/Nei family DNA glycosylase [Myxococcales bacterium]MCB9718631.1 hypothetical protein [Myxococcales bacterium]
MPEGDTLHKLALAVRPRLVGQPVEHLRLRERGEIAIVRGHPVEHVEAVGKNLLVLIDRRWTLRVHLGLRGKWRAYDASAGWEAPARSATAVLGVPSTVLAFFRSARHELHPYRDQRLEQELRRLGPDLLAPTLDLELVVARARAPGYRDLAVTDLLLDQRVAAGIGNVYRSELLFLAGLHPWAPVRELSDETLRTLFERARELMGSNLGPGPRVTVGALRGQRRRPETSRTWVYRREGLPCLRCRAPIRRSIEGRQARSTYWCPRCQPAEARGRPPVRPEK